MSYTKYKNAKANKIVNVDGTSAISSFSTAGVLKSETFDTTIVDRIGDAFVYEAHLSTSNTSTSKGFTLNVNALDYSTSPSGSTTDIFIKPNSTSLNDVNITIMLSVYLVSEGSIKYIVECNIDGVVEYNTSNPLFQCNVSDELPMSGFIKNSFEIKIITNTPNGGIVLNGTTLSKLECEKDDDDDIDPIESSEAFTPGY